MIEMLGVLAIIGVLSAGGIMGYSTAMENYKVNSFINEMDSWVMKSKAQFPRNPSSEVFLKVGTLCRIGIISADYCKRHTSDFFKSPFTKNSKAIYGDDFFVYLRLQPKQYYYSVELYDLPVRACVKIMTKRWGIRAYYSINNIGSPDIYSLPVSVSEAEVVCKNIKSGRDGGAEKRLALSVHF